MSDSYFHRVRIKMSKDVQAVPSNSNLINSTTPVLDCLTQYPARSPACNTSSSPAAVSCANKKTLATSNLRFSEHHASSVRYGIKSKTATTYANANHSKNEGDLDSWRNLFNFVVDRCAKFFSQLFPWHTQLKPKPSAPQSPVPKHKKGASVFRRRRHEAAADHYHTPHKGTPTSRHGATSNSQTSLLYYSITVTRIIHFTPKDNTPSPTHSMN